MTYLIRHAINVLLLALCGLGPVQAQQMAGSLEAGLQNLAQALLAGLPSSQRPALAVMPFPAADQACSVLSVFVVDELTTTLITAVQPRPRVVERQQLETVIAQYRLDEFLTDQEQRRRLGGLTGIGALVVGTYAVIGDRVRINARLVAIESGETFAAAAVSVPRTNELAELLRQDAGRGRNCMMSTTAPRGQDTAGGPARPSPSSPTCEEQQGLRACLQSLRLNGQDAQAILEIENIGEQELAIRLVGPPPSLLDPEGVTYSAREVIGMPICGDSLTSPYMSAERRSNCTNVLSSPNNAAALRAIAAGTRALITIRFRADTRSAGHAFIFNVAIAVVKRQSGDAPRVQRGREVAQLFLMTLPDLRPTPTPRR